MGSDPGLAGGAGLDSPAALAWISRRRWPKGQTPWV